MATLSNSSRLEVAQPARQTVNRQAYNPLAGLSKFSSDMDRIGIQNAKDEAAKESGRIAYNGQQLVVTYADQLNGIIRDAVHKGTFTAQFKAEETAKMQSGLYNALTQNGTTKDTNKHMTAFNGMTIKTGIPQRETVNQRYVKVTDAYGKESVEVATQEESALYAFQDAHAVDSGMATILGEALAGNSDLLTSEQAYVVYDKLDASRAKIYTLQQSNVVTEELVKKATPLFKELSDTLVEAIGVTSFNHFDPATTSLKQLEAQIHTAYMATMNSEEFLKFKTGDPTVDAELINNVKSTFSQKAKDMAQRLYGAKQGDFYKGVREQNALTNMASLGLGGAEYDTLVRTASSAVARERYAAAAAAGPMGNFKMNVEEEQLMYSAIRGGAVETPAEFKYFLLSNMLQTDDILAQESLLDTLDNSTPAYGEAANRLMSTLSTALTAMGNGDALVDPRVIYRVTGSMLANEELATHLMATGKLHNKETYLSGVGKLQAHAQKQIQTFDSTGKILGDLNKSIIISTSKKDK